MMLRLLGTSIVLGIALAWATPAAAIERCSVGQRVMAPGGAATVTAIQNGGVGCTVRHDNRPAHLREVYSAFMLDALAAPAAKAPATGKLKPPATATAQPASTGSNAMLGSYQCYSTTAGIMTFIVQAGGRYANEQGSTGRMNMTGPHPDRPAWRTFSLVGGPLDGFYGAILEGGRIGLSTQPRAANYNMTCDVPKKR